MCDCKKLRKEEVAELRKEISELKDMVKGLVQRPYYPYYYPVTTTYTYPVTPYTITSSYWLGDGGGNGGASA